MIKKRIIPALVLSASMFLWSCNDQATEETSTAVDITEEVEIDEAHYLSLGDSISLVAQKTLVSKVHEEMEANGPVGAVEFCNINAMPLTDEVSSQYGVKISRITDRNRNPENALKTDADKRAWEQMKALLADESIEAKHFVNQESDGIYYYKAINLAMPTCMSCHGEAGVDVLEETLAVINEKYPGDKAMGYEQGEFRALWKLKFDKQ